MAWIEAHDNLPDHPKTMAAAFALGIDQDTMAGKLLRLWTWAISYRESGFFAEYEIALIAEKMRWNKSPKKLIDALLAPPPGFRAGYLEKVEGGYRLHDWNDYAGKLIARRAKDRARKSAGNPEEALPENQKKPDEFAEISAGIPQEIHGNFAGNAPEIREHSERYRNPNRNPNQEETERANARVREALEFYEQVSGNLAPREIQEEISMRAGANCDPELVREAIRKCQGKARPAAYFVKCLQNWTAEGITDYRQYCKKYQTGQALAQKLRPRQEDSFAEIIAKSKEKTG